MASPRAAKSKSANCLLLGESAAEAGRVLRIADSKFWRIQVSSDSFSCGVEATRSLMAARPSIAEEIDVGVGIVFDCGDEVEIVADGGFVGADLGPLVADEADALRRGEGVFEVRGESGVVAWCVGGAVVALAASVGEEGHVVRNAERRWFRA